jgi:hypothetical protein
MHRAPRQYLQAHSPGIGRTPGRDQKPVRAKLAALRDQGEFAVRMADRARLRLLQHLDAFGR